MYKAIALATFALPSVAFAQVRGAYVDLQQAMKETNDGQAAEARLKADYEIKRQRRDGDERQLKRDSAELEQTSAGLTAADRARRQASIDSRKEALFREFASILKQREDAEDAETRPIFESLRRELADLARERGADVVFDKSSLVYAPATLDLTHALTLLHNAGTVEAFTAPVLHAAVVDVQKAITECHEGQAAKNALKKQFDEFQRQIDARQASLKARKAALDARGGGSPQENDALQRDLVKLQQDFQSMQARMNDEQQRNVKKILGEMDRALASIVAKKGINLVMDTSSGAATDIAGEDLTEALVASLDGTPFAASGSVGPTASTFGMFDAQRAASAGGKGNPTDRFAKIVSSAREVGAARSLTFVLESSSVDYARPDLDITDAVERHMAGEPATAGAHSMPTAADPQKPGGFESLSKAPVTRMRQDNAYAVVVGIEKYRRELPIAQYAESDAKAFKSYLVRTLGVPEDHIKLLIGEDASRAEIEAALEEWLPAQHAPASSAVYFYFSGHGAPDPATGSSYLVPFDGDPSYLKTTGLPVAQVYSQLSALHGRRVLAFLDACFSGSGPRSVLATGARPLVPVKSADVPPGTFGVFAAASANQIAGPASDAPHGLFTQAVLEGLSGIADRDGDHVVTLYELQLYVTRKVSEAARKANREQVPTLSVSKGVKPGTWTVVDGLVDP